MSAPRQAITIAQVHDADAIAQVHTLALQIWPPHYTPIIGAAQVDHMLQRLQSPAAIAAQIAGGHEYYLLYHHGVPAGYYAVTAQPPQLFLSKLYVLAELRGRGLARAALAACECRARALELDRIALVVNRHNALALAVYRRLGFCVTGEQVTDIGDGFVMDDYRLGKAVDASVAD